MEVNNNSVESAIDSTGKKERSAAHPAYNIEESLTLVAEIHKNFRYNFAKRNDILSLIKGTHPREVAAATYYTLLNREKDSYQVSETYRKIVFSISENEKRQSLLEAFYNPNLNKDLIEKFDGAELPKELVTHLSRFHFITEDAAPNAAQVFIDTAKYCGALDANNVLNYKHALIKLSDPNFKIEETITPHTVVIDNNYSNEENEQNKSEVEKNNPNKQNQILQIPEIVNSEKVKVRLTENKFAYIIHPLNITKKDISVLRKQLDVIEELIT